MIPREFIQAGSLNIRMQVERPVATPDGCGGTLNEWEAVFDVWTRIIPIKGLLINRATADASQITHWVVMRWRDDLDTKMRFVSQGRSFLIDTIYDPDESKRYLVCEVREPV